MQGAGSEGMTKTADSATVDDIQFSSVGASPILSFLGGCYGAYGRVR